MGYPDVTPAPVVEYPPVEGRIRWAAWAAGELHRKRRGEYGGGPAVWDASDWAAAEAEYTRLQGHPFVRTGPCVVCEHFGESCDGVRTQRLYGPEGSGPVYAILTWRYSYTGRHLARGRAERRITDIRLTLTGPKAPADRGKVIGFATGRANLRRAMAVAEAATGGVRWDGDTW